MATNRSGTLRISEAAQRVLASKPSYERLARAAVEEYAARLAEMDELTRNSQMTEEKAVALGRKIRKGMYRRSAAKP